MCSEHLVAEKTKTLYNKLNKKYGYLVKEKNVIYKKESRTHLQVVHDALSSLWPILFLVVFILVLCSMPALYALFCLLIIAIKFKD